MQILIFHRISFRWLEFARRRFFVAVSALSPRTRAWSIRIGFASKRSNLKSRENSRSKSGVGRVVRSPTRRRVVRIQKYDVIRRRHSRMYACRVPPKSPWSRYYIAAPSACVPLRKNSADDGTCYSQDVPRFASINSPLEPRHLWGATLLQRDATE